MEELELEQENGAEMVSFGIIAHAGDARSYAFGALEAAKAGSPMMLLWKLTICRLSCWLTRPTAIRPPWMCFWSTHRIT